MDIRIIGSVPEEQSFRYALTGFVVNGTLAIDAGPLALGLTLTEQNALRDIILTHTHIDHLATLPLFLDNRMGEPDPVPLIHSTAHNLSILKTHLFNDALWPDLTRISERFLRLQEVAPYQEVQLPDFIFHLFPVRHPTPTCGVFLEEQPSGIQVLFSADTTACDTLWEEANRHARLRAMVIELSFPDVYRDLALSSGHLTPSLLQEELQKCNRRIPIFLTHYKMKYLEAIRKDLAAIRDYDLHICRVGETIHLE